MKTKLLLLIFSLFTVLSANAQLQRCGTDQHQAALDAAYPQAAAQRAAAEDEIQRIIQNNPSYRTGLVVTIPVVFHVLYYNAAQNIPDNRLIDQLLALNLDFARLNANAGNTRSQFLPVAANTQIQFCMAARTPQNTATNGIVRIPSPTQYLPGNPHTLSPEWDHTKYLNIYVGDLNNLLGYANFPPGTVGNDHVVALYSAVGGPNFPGTYVPYHLGRTVTHEVGHWLNLHHVFNSGCAGLTNNNCTTGGDRVCDTPPQNVSHFGCPLNNPNTCTEQSPFPAPYTSDMVDMFENYMDYTDDPCMNIFTNGQATRMNSAITSLRNGLLTSLGCVPVGIEELMDQSMVTVAPNPSSGIFELNFDKSMESEITITVTDLLGKTVFEKSLSGQNGKVYMLDLSGNALGIYHMKAETKVGYLMKRLVLM